MPLSLLKHRWSSLLFLLAVATSKSSAHCECGYSTAVGERDEVVVFTDLLESDFTRIADLSADEDWIRPVFDIDKEDARGAFGESFRHSNIESFVSDDDTSQEPGLGLIVSSEPEDGLVPVAEVDSHRSDLSYGSFRTSLLLTREPGTCAAFFWYFNDTQEIDMEFLSREFDYDNKSYPVNLVVQSRQSAEAGYDASKTGNFIKADLPFDPTDGFHEYRIDFIRNEVYFYADGRVLAKMKGSSVPTSAGHLILQHWSNGNKLWSGGPPEQDAVLTVGYVKSYFNSSNPQRQKDWGRRCVDAAQDMAICEIPDVGKSKSAKDWFFSAQDNMTNNQTVSWPGDSGSGIWGAKYSLLLVWAMSLTAFLHLL